MNPIRHSIALGGALASACLLFAATSHAECLAPPGDFDGSLETDIADTQCQISGIIADFLGNPAPACLAGPSSDLDLSGDGVLDVTDVKLMILLTLGMEWPQSYDADGDYCANAFDPPTTVHNATLHDFFTGSPLVGAVVNHDNSLYFTGGDGKASFEVPQNSPYEFAVTADGFWTANVLYHSAEFPSFNSSRSLVSIAAQNQVAAALGIGVDDTKGILVVVVTERVDDSSIGGLAGTTVGVDSAYDIALATSSAAPGGLLPFSTTIQPNSPPNVIFVNMEPGPVDVTLTPSEPANCAVIGGNVEDRDVIIYPGQYTIVGYWCEVL
jgi:hypothetical protein